MPKGIIRIYMGYPWVRPASGSDPKGVYPISRGVPGVWGGPGHARTTPEQVLSPPGQNLSAHARPKRASA